MNKILAYCISKSYDKKKKVVNNVTLDLESGEIVGLLGPNGAGKTSTFYIVTGLIQPDSGKILLNNIDITSKPLYKRARLGISYLCQENSIFRNLSVEDNLRAIFEIYYKDKKEVNNKIDDLINEFNLEKVRNNKGYSLSGGERRRAEIARTLILSPKFILLDEPFAGVDPIAVKDINNILNKIKKKGIGVLITDHNAQATLKVIDKAFILSNGKIKASGSPETIIKSKYVQENYLGTDFKL